MLNIIDVFLIAYLCLIIKYKHKILLYIYLTTFICYILSFQLLPILTFPIRSPIYLIRLLVLSRFPYLLALLVPFHPSKYIQNFLIPERFWPLTFIIAPLSIIQIIKGQIFQMIWDYQLSWVSIATWSLTFGIALIIMQGKKIPAPDATIIPFFGLYLILDFYELSVLLLHWGVQCLINPRNIISLLMFSFLLRKYQWRPRWPLLISIPFIIFVWINWDQLQSLPLIFLVRIPIVVFFLTSLLLIPHQRQCQGK